MKKNVQTTLLMLSVFSSLLVGQTVNHVVISEVYGGGGNSGATWKNDFIELYNPTSSPVNLAGWSVQYGSATGTSSWQVTNLTGSIAPHGYFLVQEAVGAGGTLNLPTPDNIGGLTMSGTAGKVALVSSTTALNGANPTDASVVDKVGYGSTANGYEGAGPTPAPSNTTSVERKANATSTAISLAAGGGDANLGNGYDTDGNSTDFVAQSDISPQNSSSTQEPSLVVGGNGTGTATIAPNKIQAGDSAEFTITVVGDGTNTLDSLIVVIPTGWNWGRNSSNVVTSGTGLASATVAVLQDTIFVGHCAITGTDTGKAKISYIQAPSLAGSGGFLVKTGSQGGSPVIVASTVAVTVVKVVPIIDVHVNNAIGVCAAPYGVGATVTVSGIVTADLTSTRTDIYVQDGTAGINIFRASRSFSYQVGDSVTVTGTITQFRGLTEVGLDSTKYVVHASGLQLPEPLLLTAADVNATFNTENYTEVNEGRLVRLNGVTYNSTTSTFTDATGTTGAFIPTSLVAPNGVCDVIGILKQFKDPNTTPYTANYEVQPRTQSDIILYPGPVISVVPMETDITSDSVAIVWKTQTAASGFVKFGVTGAYTDSVGTAIADTSHKIVLKNLQPATVYHYQVGSGDGNGVTVTGDRLFSSASSSASSGTMNVWFNKTISASVALAETAKTVTISTKLIARINTATHSLDVCLYSLSGTVGANIASALVSAKNRGVKVRMIGEKDNQSTAPWATLKSGSIPVIDDGYDLVNAGNGLMHNKFVVFDNRDNSSAADDWVWMGSWNATDPGNDNDAQNVIEIQDQALANAYTMEFNEMWGSSTDTPNQNASRFGARKQDNTPHRFNVKGTPMELYFSPSDRTTSQIQAALNGAMTSVNIALLTFTRDDLSQALISKKGAGKKVRVILDNNTDSGNEFANLSTAGVDIRLKAPSTGGLLHHKYAVIDAESPNDGNVVVTGSHNWSNSAETSNNENTLIIHSKRIANLYLQEFKQRYIDAGGSDNITVGVADANSMIPDRYSLSQNYPNPFNPTTVISFQLPVVTNASLKVFDILGREVATLVDGIMTAGVYHVAWDASRQPSGVYFVRLSAAGFSAIKKAILLK
ncbi:MAG: phospholipase D-like domain-containing protein [Bacteroidota bacterium]